MGPTTIFACETQPIVIEGLQRVFAANPEFVLAGSTPTYADALVRIPPLQPLIVLTDQSGGLKLLLRFLGDLKSAAPEAFPVLWISELAESECFRALQLGARGILKKTMPVTALLECLRTVRRGDVWMENTFPNHMAGFLHRKQVPRLTPRERDIVRCLARGLRNKEIAAELAITPGTVKVHLMHIFEKTGVKDRFELAVHGRTLLGPEDDDLRPPAGVPGVA